MVINSEDKDTGRLANPTQTVAKRRAELAREAAFDEAVERMARVDWERLRQVYNDPKYGRREPMAAWEDADEGEREAYRDRAALMLRALLSDSVQCETCGGTGERSFFPVGDCEHGPPEQVTEPCPAGCDHGQVSQPSLAVLRADLEQVGWRHIGTGDCFEFGKWDYIRPEAHEPLYRENIVR